MESVGLIVALAPPSVYASGKSYQPAYETELSSEDPSEQQRQDELYEKGKRAYEAGDFVSAIEPWQELYDTVPLLNRIHLFNPLGRAHWNAYQIDKNEEHLAQARAMFERNLEAVYGDDQASRATREVLDEVDAELKQIEDAREKKKREDAENKAIAKERRRQEQQEQQEREARRQRQNAERQALLERENRRFRLHATVGGSVAGLGVMSLATAAVGLGLGAKVDRDGFELLATPDATLEEFQALRRSGHVYNRLAITTGAIGGALVLSGAVMLIVGTVRLKRTQGDAKIPVHVRVVPGLAGAEVRF